MRVLFFTYDFPYPTTSGGKSRAYNLLKHAGKNIELFLFSFTREIIDTYRIEQIKKIGIKDIRLFPRKKLSNPTNLLAFVNPKTSIFHSLYFDRKIASALKSAILDWKIDIVHFESFYTAFFLNSSLSVKQIFGTENIEYRLYEEYAKYIAPLFLKPFYFWEAKKIKSEETAFYKLADCTIAVLENEASYITEVSGKPCFAVPNAIDLSYFSFKQKKSDEKKKTVLFIGNFRYFPNVDGAKFFYEQVFSKFPSERMEFMVVGENAHTLRFLKNDKRVKFFDYLEDIRDAYYAADIFVSPIRIGGGTNFKILEAMACGVPVIALPQRAGSIGARDGEDILFARNGQEFVSQIGRLVKEQKIVEDLQRNARAFVEEHYSWEKIGKKLNTVWKSL